jgi:glutathione-regulated potassium-efflux system ancillary protein KefC
MRFRRHNLQLFEQMYPHYRNRSKLIAVAKEGRNQFEQQMAQERAELAQRRRAGGEGPTWGEEAEEST